MDDKKSEYLLAEKSFVLWIKGTCSAADKNYWDAWLREDPEHRKLVKEAREIIAAMNTEYDIPDPKGELEKLDGAIDRYEEQGRGFRVKTYEPLYRKSRRPVAAGIIFLIALLGGVFAYQNYGTKVDSSQLAKATVAQEYSTDYGEKVTFSLSDGSRIVLNANSSLKFSSEIKKGLNTEVWLEGEAWFNIAHLEGGRQRTFTVHTNDGSIQVLGTRFAVNTFGKETQAVLEEGKISVRIKDQSPDASTEYLLEPGEMARFTAHDNKIAIKAVNIRVYTSWMQDKLFFENTPMEEVARRIEDTFGPPVIVGDELADERLTGSIKSTNLKVLIEALSEILHAPVTKQDHKIFIGPENRNRTPLNLNNK